MNAKVVTQLPAHILGEFFFHSRGPGHCERLVRILAVNPRPGIVALADIIDGPLWDGDDLIEVTESHDLTRAYADNSEIGFTK